MTNTQGEILEMKPAGFFQDSQGNRSSKRIAGTIILGTGALFLLGIGCASVVREISDPSTALAVGKTLIITGASLLGVGVVEKFGGAR